VDYVNFLITNLRSYDRYHASPVLPISFELVFPDTSTS